MFHIAFIPPCVPQLTEINNTVQL